jgi:hypothetical protein
VLLIDVEPEGNIKDKKKENNNALAVNGFTMIEIEKLKKDVSVLQ